MQPDAPMLSVIVPVFNGAATLAEALTSILRQDVAGLEIIVIDDGSQDGSAGVAASVSPGILVVHQANQGPAAARNRGLELARGQLITFLDADDIWPEGRVRHHLQLFGGRPGTEMVIGPTRFVSLADAAEGTTRALLPAPLIQHHVGSATMLRGIFDRVGRFDTSVPRGDDDRDWFKRALAAGIQLEITREVALEYRRRPGSLTAGVTDHGHWFLLALRDHLQRKRRQALSEGHLNIPAAGEETP